MRGMGDEEKMPRLLQRAGGGRVVGKGKLEWNGRGAREGDT